MSQAAPHIPVLLEPVLQAFAPVSDGVVVDGTFGARRIHARFIENLSQHTGDCF